MEGKEDECLPPSPASLWCIANMDDEESEARALESTTYVESPIKLPLSLEVGPPRFCQASLFPNCANK